MSVPETEVTPRSEKPALDFTSKSYGMSSYAELLCMDDQDTARWKYQPGDVVMEELPFASVISPEYIGEICHSCYRREAKEAKLKRCVRCRFARYCGDTCAKKAWPVHKMECTLLGKYHEETGFFPDALIRLVNLIMNKAWMGQMTMPPESCTPSTDRGFDNLCSHTNEIDEELEKSEKFKQNMHEIKRFIGKETLLELGGDIVAEVYSRVVTNTISIPDRGGNILGIGIYLGISQFDHSCVPNALYIARSSPPQLQIIATAPIESLDKVRIAYIDPLKPTQLRRAELKDSYYFSCSCLRCHSIERDGMARSLKCPGKNCGGFILLGKDWLPLGPCEVCLYRMDQTDERLKDGKDLMLTIQQFLSENHTTLDFSESKKKPEQPDEQLILSLLALGQEADDYLFRLNYYRLAISTCLVGYYSLMQDDPRKKAPLLTDLIDSYRFGLGPISVPALQACIDVSQTHVRLRNWKVAEEYAEQARDIASCVFSPDDAYFSDIEEVLSHCKVQHTNPVIF